MIIRDYWYLARSALLERYSPFEHDLLPGPPQFLHHVRPAQGLVLGAWNESDLVGTVIIRYGFADLFAERFPDLDSITFVRRLPPADPSRRLPTLATPGYVYVIRSPYGFKIGKTVNMKSRTRLFEVKLPFPITVEHYAWFADYSTAEHELHRTFHAKRLEGEWFDLEPGDIAYIRTLGRPATVEELRQL